MPSDMPWTTAPRIINMSFGKSYSPYKSVVDKAVKHAEKNDVLLIHAAGNSSKDIDVKDNFPTQTYESGKNAKNWLEIGALSWKNGEESVATFSNFGKNSVDVFAPGVDIYSTAPDQEYENASGTSMGRPCNGGSSSHFEIVLSDIVCQAGTGHYHSIFYETGETRGFKTRKQGRGGAIHRPEQDRR